MCLLSSAEVTGYSMVHELFLYMNLGAHLDVIGQFVSLHHVGCED